MSHAATYNPTLRIAQARGWRLSADCRCGHDRPVKTLGLPGNMLLRDLERRLRCTHCGSRKCRLVVDGMWGETPAERAAKARRDAAARAETQPDPDALPAGSPLRGG